LELCSIRRDDCLVISPKGRLDTISAPDFLKEVEAAISEGDWRVVLDCSHLEYVSSAGLRVILVLAKRCKSSGGALACFGLRDMVKRVFDVSGFSSLVPVRDTIDDAVSDCR
jgi:anti-anti-sigma factor